MSYAYTEEPDKVFRRETPPEDLPSIHDLVLFDLKKRKQFGVKKYGVELKGFDGSDPLKEMYQELLDAVIYCRQALYERDGE